MMWSWWSILGWRLLDCDEAFVMFCVGTLSFYETGVWRLNFLLKFCDICNGKACNNCWKSFRLHALLLPLAACWQYWLASNSRYSHTDTADISRVSLGCGGTNRTSLHLHFPRRNFEFLCVSLMPKFSRISSLFYDMTVSRLLMTALDYVDPEWWSKSVVTNTLHHRSC